MTNDIGEKTEIKMRTASGRNRPMLILFDLETSLTNDIIEKALLKRLQRLEQKYMPEVDKKPSKNEYQP